MARNSLTMQGIANPLGINTLQSLALGLDPLRVPSILRVGLISIFREG
jgi:hypothetical protein